MVSKRSSRLKCEIRKIYICKIKHYNRNKHLNTLRNNLHISNFYAYKICEGKNPVERLFANICILLVIVRCYYYSEANKNFKFFDYDSNKYNKV
jgi:hypothetical protein